MGGYYNRKLEPIALDEWSKLLNDKVYQRVAETTLPSGVWISTVWLGLDHRHGGFGLPLIFESMAFDPSKPETDTSRWSELDAARYCTEEEALAGHAAMVTRFKNKETT